MIKNLFIIPFFLVVYIPLQSTVHEILVWDGYMQFMPVSLNIELGDTIHFLPLDFPLMMHTITSSNIPFGAISFDETWQAPSDTFFEYIPLIEGLYEYVCTPHLPNMVASFNVLNSGTSFFEYNHNKKLIKRINLIGFLIHKKPNYIPLLLVDF